MPTPESSPPRRGIRAAFYLTLFALIAAVLLSTVERLTGQRITDNELAERLAALSAVLPGDQYDNQPHLDRIYVRNAELLGSDEALPVYRARNGEQPVAAVLTAVAPNGFSGEIRLLIAIDAGGEVAGVRVIEHRETPGLGDAIEADKSNWIESFTGLDGSSLATNPLAREWILDRDGGRFDHITSATVTSRAVVKAVRNAVIYFDLNREKIFTIPAAPQDEGPER